MNARHDADKELPPKKEFWDHSKMVLVYYDAIPELDLGSCWSIAYYHYNPPFKKKGEWTDFNIGSRVPKYWWHLPEV